MPSLFSRIRGKDGKSKKGAGLTDLTSQLPSKPRWDDAYTRTEVEPEEVVELVRRCTEELKSRALAQELRMTEPMVISGVIKWCWSRIQGGVVGWDAYELFKVGESDSNMARNAFTTFIPLSVDNDARSKIIFDYFDLMSAVAAHGKSNGFGGRKLSRMASWWAFEYKDTGNGFDGGYKFWLGAADATTHLFFAYLRSLGPETVVGGISMLPRSLQKLLHETEYPPQTPSLMQSSTYRVNMIVDTVSPTPFALLRRANHFQYRDSDRALYEYSEYEDPVRALTEECRRVLKAISLANQSQVSSSKVSTGLRDASWSRFEDIGFAGSLDEDDVEDEAPKSQQPRGLRTTPASGGLGGARPTTPSWADFLSSGFVDDSPNSPTSLLPPDKVLPPIDANLRQRSSQSHRPRLESNQQLEPGELASINMFDFDDAFWWVWMSSLAPEETPERKAAFGRCAIIETVIRSGRWLIMEETVKGAAAEPDANAYIAEKKGFFSWTRRNKGVSRSKSTGKKGHDKNDRLKPSATVGAGLSKTSIGPDQQAKIQAAALQLQRREAQEQYKPLPQRRGRTDTEVMKEKTNSVLTMQPVIMKEASPAMKWANKYDKDAIREAYLGNVNAGRGLGQATMQTNGYSENGETPTNGAHYPEVPEESPSITSPVTSKAPAVLEPRVPMQEVEHPAEPERPFDPERNIHPAERTGLTGRNSPLPPTGRNSPLPPPPQENSFEAGRETLLSPEPGHSHDQKPKKLHKDEKKASGGLRKLFSRRNRSSKLPENASNDLNAMLAQQPAAASQRRLQPIPSETAVNRPEEPDFVTPAEQPEDLEFVHSPASPPVPEPAYEASIDDDLSRVDTADAHEAHHEFSRFDQGPLADQPAFVPGDEYSEDDATPPPIARHTTNHSPQSISSDTEEQAAPSPTVPMQDRWAQIRQNAAARARQSEEQSRGGYSKTTDDDDNTSGEETIESRVARIKARVAELTGNMEGTTAPGSRTPPRR
ncbi:hypothetical protein TruAng_009960 [Truncatella angustata]|nr:hypothetical protein TruAng_009960 [Truncatella angustata]